MSLDAWLGSDDPLSGFPTVDRTLDTARRIAQRPTSITVVSRLAGALPGAQTVRLEPLSAPREQAGSVGVQVDAGILILGYKDHPTIADTDVQRGDRFLYEDRMYTVTGIIPNTPDRVLAVAEASE